MPTYTKQTLKQAKASYKKHGPRTSEKEQRQLERGIELDRRAKEHIERERRRKEASKKRKEKEEKKKEIRNRMGVGLATQLAGFSHTQKQLKGAMESFLGLGKNKQSPRHVDAAAEASVAAAMKHDSLMDADDDIFLSSPLDASVHSQGGNGGGEICAGAKSSVPAPPSTGKGSENYVLHRQLTRAGEALITEQSVQDSKQEGFQSPSKTTCGHQDTTRKDAPAAKSSQSDMFDDMLDDATILSALKGKTPTSQAARQCSHGPTPMSHKPTSPCNQTRYRSERVHLLCKRKENCEEQNPSFTQPVDEDPLAAIDFDYFDDLFPSNSQIQRELTPPKPTKSDKLTVPQVDLAAQGLREIEGSLRAAQAARASASRSRPRQPSGRAHGASPSHVKPNSVSQSFGTTKPQHGNGSDSHLRPSDMSLHLQDVTDISRSRPLPSTSSMSANISKSQIHHGAMAPARPPGVRYVSGNMLKQINSPEFKRPAIAPLGRKRKIVQETAASLHPPVKKQHPTDRPGESRPRPSFSPRCSSAANATKPWTRSDLKSTSTLITTPTSRFGDFGLSTQILGDAIDDDLDLSP